MSPAALYGLVAKEVEISDDRKALRFFLRPEATFHDGSPLTAEDVSFSLETLRDKGHPNIATDLLGHGRGHGVEDEHTLFVKLKPDTGAQPADYGRRVPIFSRAWWEGRDFTPRYSEAPLGSGPYKVGDYSFGNYIEFERVDDWWANDLPANASGATISIASATNIIATARRRSKPSRRAPSRSARSSPRAHWATGYDFPAVKDGRVIKDDSAGRADRPARRAGSSTCGGRNSPTRACGCALTYAFDFEWMNKNIMFGSYERTALVLRELAAEGGGQARARGAGAARAAPRQSSRTEVFGEAFVPPVSDGSGRDRAMLQKANELLTAAGCKRERSSLLSPDGTPLTIEFLDDDSDIRAASHRPTSPA